jgi:hypothetical protein
MTDQLPGEGKTFKQLSDGRVVFYSMVARKTVVLDKGQFDRLLIAVRRKIWLSQAAAIAIAAALVFGWLGKIPVLVAALIVLACAALSWLSQAAMKRLHRQIVERSPLSDEQLPGLSVAEMPQFILRNVPDRYLRLIFWVSLATLMLAAISVAFEVAATYPPNDANLSMKTLALPVSAAVLFFIAFVERQRRHANAASDSR